MASANSAPLRVNLGTSIFEAKELLSEPILCTYSVSFKSLSFSLTTHLDRQILPDRPACRARFHTWLKDKLDILMLSLEEELTDRADRTSQ